MAKDFLGTGMAFPPRIDPATGRVVMSSGLQSIKESVYLILMTQTTERITRPTFGTDTAEYVFMDMNQTYLTIMKRDLTESILRQEPRISSVDVETELESQQGYILINIDYTVADTNQRDNLVFPFYLNAEPAPDEEEEYYEPDVIDIDMFDTEE